MLEIKGLDNVHANTSAEFTTKGLAIRISIGITKDMYFIGQILHKEGQMPDPIQLHCHKKRYRMSYNAVLTSSPTIGNFHKAHSTMLTNLKLYARVLKSFLLEKEITELTNQAIANTERNGH